MIYDTIGHNYLHSRRADPRVTEAIYAALALSPGVQIVDIGAGTGNYSAALADQGFQIIAVEPSYVMRDQGNRRASIRWIAGTAEALPLGNSTVTGAVCILALHHFTRPAAAFREIHRVVGQGPLVLLTFDPRLSEPFWFSDYFPTLWQDSYTAFPPLDTIMTNLAEATGYYVRSEPLLLPPDLRDLFAVAGWQRPAIYLDPAVRAGMSPFALADQQVVNDGVARLQRDLETGAWQQAHGQLLARSSFDAGYRLLIAAPA